MAKFCERLKELRREKGLSQQELANQIGTVSKSSINMYERGEREPSFETMELFADFFNADLDYLMGKTDTRNRYSYAELMRQIIAEKEDGRYDAKEDFFRVFGDEHALHATRIVGEKYALLYYKPFDNQRMCADVSSVISLIDEMPFGDIEFIPLLVRAYLAADERTRVKILRTLRPFFPKEFLLDLDDPDE